MIKRLGRSLQILSDEATKQIFNLSESKSTLEIVRELQLMEDGKRTKRAAMKLVSHALKRVIDDPVRFGVLPERVKAVKLARQERAIATPHYKEQQRELQDIFSDPEKMILHVRELSMETLRRKLNLLLKSPDLLEDVNIASLGTLVGILYDKGRLAEGKSTRNIAAKLDIPANLTPENALAIMLKLRKVSEAKQKKEGFK